MKTAEIQHKWEKLFFSERSFSKRFLLSLLIAIFGFVSNFIVFELTGYYFPTIGTVTIILLAFYGGLLPSLILAIILRIVADYYFILPHGFPNSYDGYERLLISITLAIFVSYIGSSLRSAFRKTFIAKQEAEHASILMEKVLSLVSHDLRTPLTSISMGAQLILRTPGQSDKHQPILARIIRSVEYADSLIQSILDITRIRAGKTLPQEFKFNDLSIQIAKIVEELSLMENNRIILAQNDSIFGAWGISGIRRALENLINNAIKYGEPNTPITIELLRKDNNAVLSVHNQGPVISIEDQQTLFEAFQRTDESEASRKKGWGLGLALVKGIAEAHGGVVKVYSTKETGTRFSLELPIRKLEEIT